MYILREYMKSHVDLAGLHDDLKFIGCFRDIH